MTTVLLINGPNLNLLGRREPEKYGHGSFDSLIKQLTDAASNYHLTHLQSNAEHALIDRIHLTLDDKTDAIVINPGAFTHTSIALRDALLAVNLPVFEIHISNIYARESFRHHSYFSDIAHGVICGLGTSGYQIAIDAAVSLVKQNNSSQPSSIQV